MKSAGWICAATMVLGVAVGTATAEASTTGSRYAPDAVFNAGKTCSNRVMKEAHGLPGKTVLKSIPYGSGYAESWGGVSPGSISSTLVKSIPYVTATAIDHGNPGSQWRKCMMQKGEPVPKK